jgi:hypothetical protein
MHLWKVRMPMRGPLIPRSRDAPSGSEPALAIPRKRVASAGERQAMNRVSSPLMVPTTCWRRGGIERDADQMRGARRGLEHDQAGGRLGRADPFGEQGAKAPRRAWAALSWSGSA